MGSATFGIDTCCIDKRSSAELSEAINSMYKWYQGAKVCYAFLSEIVARPGFEIGPALAEEHPSGQDAAYSVNFTTPVKRFESETWSIAQRTSWTSGRRTTRIEDRAHSLLGIFQVNMLLHYGEGSRAFQRLQEEIVKVSNDISIFAWLEGANKSFGMLAGSPDSFTATPGYNCFLAADDEYSLSKTGLSGSFYLIPHASNVVVEPLGSYTKGAADSALTRVRLGILLQQQPESCYKPVTVNGQRCILTRGAWAILPRSRLIGVKSRTGIHTTLAYTEIWEYWQIIRRP